MSLKVYDGYIFSGEYPVDELIERIRNLGPLAREAAREQQAEYLSQIFTFKIDDNFIKDDKEDTDIYNFDVDEYIGEIFKTRQDRSRRMERYVEGDWQLSFAIYLLKSGHTLLRCIAEKQNIYAGLVDLLPGVSEYNYIGTIDASGMGLSEEDFEKRYELWDETTNNENNISHLPIIINLVPIEGIAPSLKDIVEKTPSKENRAKRLAKNKIINEIFQSMNVEKISVSHVMEAMSLSESPKNKEKTKQYQKNIYDSLQDTYEIEKFFKGSEKDFAQIFNKWKNLFPCGNTMNSIGTWKADNYEDFFAKIEKIRTTSLEALKIDRSITLAKMSCFYADLDTIETKYETFNASTYNKDQSPRSKTWFWFLDNKQYINGNVNVKFNIRKNEIIFSVEVDSESVFKEKIINILGNPLKENLLNEENHALFEVLNYFDKTNMPLPEEYMKYNPSKAEREDFILTTLSKYYTEELIINNFFPMISNAIDLENIKETKLNNNYNLNN